MSRYSNEVGRALATAMQAQRAEADAQHEIERLRAEHAQRTAERDEARREVCQILANPSLVTDLAIPGEGSAEDFADERGWDCFDAKEVK